MAQTDTKTVAIRLVVVDGGAVKAELRDVGATGEQALQRIDSAAGNTSRALTVIDGNAVSASRSLVTLDQASGGVTRSLSTANDNARLTVESFEKIGGAADRTSKAVAAIPAAFQLLAGLLAIDVAIRSVGLLKNIVVELGRELGDQIHRLNEWAEKQGNATEVAVKEAEFLAGRYAALRALEAVGVSALTRTALGAASTGLFVGVEAAGALVEASKAARDYAAAQRAVADELDRTGHSSQRTAADILALSKTLAEGTRYTTVEIANAGRELLNFRGIAGTTFDRAMKASADLAAKMGTDLPTAATLLGRALEDPTRGTAELAEKGINLTQAQREQIKSFADAGEKAEAQGVILDAVAAKTGDAASKMTEAERASKHLADAWDALAVTIGTRLNSVLDDLAAGWNAVGTAIGNTLAPLKELMAGGLTSLNAALTADPLDKQLADTASRLEAAKAAYNKAIADGDHEEGARLGMDVEILERKKATLERQIDAARQRAEQERREIGQRQRDERGERFAGERTSLDRQLESVVKGTTADQIARVNAELEKTKAKFEALREPDGSNKGAIDKAIADAEKIAKARREAIEKAAKDTGTGRSDDPIDRQIDALREERDALGLTARERAVHTALVRAEQAARQQDTALTRDQIETIQFEAGALYDAKTAQDAHTKAMAEGKSIAEAMRTPAEAYADQMRRLNDLLNEGAINWAMYERAAKSAQDKLDGAGKNTGDVARQIGMSFESAFENAVIRGQKLRNVLASLAEDLARLAMRKAVTEPLFNYIGKGISAVAGSFFHEGGIVGGAPTFTRGVAPALFDGAPRYHEGGVAGLAPGEVPAILKQGEGVFTPEQMAALGGTGDGSTVINNPTVNVTVNFEGSPGEIPPAEMSAQIQRAVMDQLKGFVASEILKQQRPGGMLYGGY